MSQKGDWTTYAAKAATKTSEGARGAWSIRAVEDFNERVAVGATVLYWPGAREGEGRIGIVSAPAYLLGSEAMVHIEGVAGGIALTHIEIVVDFEDHAEAYEEMVERMVGGDAPPAPARCHSSCTARAETEALRRLLIAAHVKITAQDGFLTEFRELLGVDTTGEALGKLRRSLEMAAKV